MCAQPGLERVGVAVRQHLDPLARLGVDQDRGIPAPPGQREVVDPQNPRHTHRGQSAAQQDPHHGVPRSLDTQCGQRPLTTAAGQFSGHRSNLACQPGGAALMALQDAGQLLAEGVAGTFQRRAHQPAHPHHHATRRASSATSASVRS